MGKHSSSSNPTIRVLILGAPGVGKNCLESRFTTMTYPPPYDPALTLNSRRFFTLSPRPPTAVGSVTRPLNTSNGPALRDSTSIVEEPRPHTASSTFSNPASEHREEAEAGPSGAQHQDGESVDDRTLVNSECCTECSRANNSYLVEVINYPTLQLPKVRAHVHGKAEYDAALLVYDVASRKSFDAVKALHDEIPICTRKNHNHHRRAAHSSGRERRSSGWFGGGTNETGVTGSGEIVVGLVGNKSDFDAEYASVELGLDGPLLEKEAELQEEEVKRRSLVHPLFRESQILDHLQLRDPREPQSPTESLNDIALGREAAVDARRSIMSADHVLFEKRRSVLSKRSTRTLPTPREKTLPKIPARSDRTAAIEKWLQAGKSRVEDPAELDEDCARIDSNETESTMAARRQVSRLDGESLARELMLQVPFYETSAKSGENVEEVFEAMIREVLRETGRGTSSSKPCKHKLHHRYEKKEATMSPATAGMPQELKGSKDMDKETKVSTDIFSAYAPKPTDSASKGVKLTTAVEEVGEGQDEAQPQQPPRKVRRRESMMSGLRKVFTRKQPSIVTETAA